MPELRIQSLCPGNCPNDLLYSDVIRPVPPASAESSRIASCKDSEVCVRRFAPSKRFFDFSYTIAQLLSRGFKFIQLVVCCIRLWQAAPNIRIQEINAHWISESLLVPPLRFCACSTLRLESQSESRRNVSLISAWVVAFSLMISTWLVQMIFKLKSWNIFAD